VVNNTDLALSKMEEDLEGATWVSAAPEQIGPGEQVAWQCEAGGPLGDTKGWVAYRAGDAEQVVIRWDNPNRGDSAYVADLPDNSTLDVAVDGQMGNHADVTYTITPAQASSEAEGEVAGDTGLIADASYAAGVTPVVDPTAVAALDQPYADDPTIDAANDAAVANAGDLPTDTPTRGVKIYFTNNTDLTLVKQEEAMLHGVWELLPLDAVDPSATVQWECVSEGVQSGVEGYVIYSPDSDATMLFTLRWNNPYVDTPSYSSEVPTGYTVQVSGGVGDYAEVSYTLTRFKIADLRLQIVAYGSQGELQFAPTETCLAWALVCNSYFNLQSAILNLQSAGAALL